MISWKIEIYDAFGGLKKTILNTDGIRGIVDGFKWSSDGYGSCVALEFSGVNSILQIRSKDMIRLFVNNSAVWYGFFHDTPNINSKTIAIFNAVGAKEKLKEIITNNRPYQNLGAYTLARAVVQEGGLGGGGVLAPDISQIATGSGPMIDLLYMPYSTVFDFIQRLAEYADTKWGVDENGRLCFKKPASIMSIPYSGQFWQHLQVEGRETVTRAVVNMVVNTGSSDNIPPRFQQGYSYFNNGAITINEKYIPAQHNVIYTHGENNIYRAARVFSMPDYLPSVIDGIGSQVVFTDNNGNSLAEQIKMHDGDSNTFYDLPATKYVNLDFVNANAAVVGFRIRYVTPLWDIRESEGWEAQKLTIKHFNADGRMISQIGYEIPEAKSMKEWIVLSPAHEITEGYTTSLNFSISISRNLNIYEVVPLIANRSAAMIYAQSKIRLPGTNPVEITINTTPSYVETVTVENSPNGTITASAQMYECVLTGKEGIKTTIKLDSRGETQTARAISALVDRKLGR